MKLFLDDERNPYVAYEMTGNPVYLDTDWVIVRDFDAFKFHITVKEFPEMVSFDNDLGLGLEGYDCAKFLVDYCLDEHMELPKWMVHSANPVARENIAVYFKSFEKHRTNIK